MAGEQADTGKLSCLQIVNMKAWPTHFYVKTIPKIQALLSREFDSKLPENWTQIMNCDFDNIWKSDKKYISFVQQQG